MSDAISYTLVVFPHSELPHTLMFYTADLKPDNIMVRLEDASILHKDAQDEFLQPLPQKQYPDRTIYLSRNNYGQPSSVPGLIAITDFGDAVQGHEPHYGCIQAEPYRAPEVILDAGWSYGADIWSLGAMVQPNIDPLLYKGSC